MGAAMVRNSAMAEEIDIAVDTAAGHVARTTTLMTGVYLADPAAFPGVVGLPGSMALCDRYAAQVNEMMGAPSE